MSKTTVKEKCISGTDYSILGRVISENHTEDGIKACLDAIHIQQDYLYYSIVYAIHTVLNSTNEDCVKASTITFIISHMNKKDKNEVEIACGELLLAKFIQITEINDDFWFKISSKGIVEYAIKKLSEKLEEPFLSRMKETILFVALEIQKKEQSRDKATRQA